MIQKAASSTLASNPVHVARRRMDQRPGGS